MCDDASLIVWRLYDAWRRQNVGGVLACCAADIVYMVYPSQPEHRSLRIYRGRYEVAAYLHAMCWEWRFLELDPSAVRVSPDGICVRERVRFKAEHRATGNILESTKRHVWHLRDGLVTRCDEFEDTGLIRAFMQMADGI